MLLCKSKCWLFKFQLGFVRLGSVQGQKASEIIWKLDVPFWPGPLKRQLWGQRGSFYNLDTGPHFQKRKVCCMTYLFSSRFNIFWFVQKQFKYPQTWISRLFSLRLLAETEETVAQWKCQAYQCWTTDPEDSVTVYKMKLLPLKMLLVF